MLPHVLLLSAAIIWGWTFVATKILVAELGPVDLFALRLAIGLPFVGGLLLLKGVRWRFTRDDIAPLCAGGVMFTPHFLVQISGLLTTTATNSAWIIGVSPLALAVLSFVFLRERIGWNGVAGIVIASAGILLLVSRGNVMDLRWLESTGDWLVLASAHTWALYTVVTRDVARRRDPLAVTFAILSIASAFTLLFWIRAGDAGTIRSLSPSGVAALLYLAIPGLALGQWFWQEGVARLGASRAGLYLYLEPMATSVLAVPLLGEPFGPITALGGALVLAGVYVGHSV